jgi:hypothetical protein
VQFLANRTNSSITAEVETVLQKIKKEEKEEEIKSPPEQERTDFVREIEEQSQRKIMLSDSSIKVFYIDELQEMASKSKEALKNLLKLLEKPSKNDQD